MCSPALHDLCSYATLVAQCSLSVLKVPLNTNEWTNHTVVVSIKVCLIELQWIRNCCFRWIIQENMYGMCSVHYISTTWTIFYVMWSSQQPAVLRFMRIASSCQPYVLCMSQFSHMDSVIILCRLARMLAVKWVICVHFVKKITIIYAVKMKNCTVP